MALLLNEAEVTMLLPMTLALEAVEDAFRAQGEGKLTNKPRVRLSVPGGLLHVMPAALPDARVMGLKSYATVRGTCLALTWRGRTRKPSPPSPVSASARRSLKSTPRTTSERWRLA